MKKLLLILAVAALTAFNASAVLLNVEIFDDHSGAGDGTPFSSPVGSYTTDWIGNTAAPAGALGDFAWHPFGRGEFGARITGLFSAPAAGVYSFGTESDDGSRMYIDGVLVVDNGGAHGPTTVFASAPLTAGLHTMVINFFEDFGGPSGVEGYIDDLLTPVPVPEPSTYFAGALLVLVFGAQGIRSLRSRKQAA
jgi:hypothetical protein